jgi:hypothetical protein
MGLVHVFRDIRYVPLLEQRTIATIRSLGAKLYGNNRGLPARRRKLISGIMPFGQGLTI